MKELLEKLATTYGPSGNEELVREVIKEEIRDCVDKIDVDALGNLIAVRKGSEHGKRIMLAAHMDQIGLMVTHIDEKGFLRFTNIGGISALNTIRRKVIFKNGITGVVSYEGGIEDIKDIKLNRMYIDIGASDYDEALNMVNIGDVAVYYSQFIENNGHFISAAMDNRSGCAVLIKTIKELKESPNELYFVFTVQEELGLRGARTAAFAIDPDLAVAIDVTGTGDTPRCRPMAVSLGEGPAIKVKDASIIAHPKVKELMVSTAKQNGIPYQLEILDAGGTDSGAIHLTKEGIPSGVMSIPCRYIHSDNEVVDGFDMEKGVDLMVAILSKNIDL